MSFPKEGAKEVSKTDKHKKEKDKDILGVDKRKEANDTDKDDIKTPDNKKQAKNEQVLNINGPEHQDGGFDDDSFDEDDLHNEIDRLSKLEEEARLQSPDEDGEPDDEGPDGEKKSKKNKKKGKKSGTDVQPSSSNWYKNWVTDWEDENNKEIDSSDEEELMEREKEDAELANLDKMSAEEQTSWLTRKARKKFGDVWEMVEIYCKDWEDGPLDIATFFFCLAAFHSAPRNKKEAIFDEKLILTGYHYGQFAFAAYKGTKALVLERLPFLEDADYIDGNWDKLSLLSAPAFFLALDHDQKTVILSLRGTKQKQDILVDLTAQYVKWKTGYAHRGFVKSLNQLEPFVRPLVEKEMKNHPGYKLRIVGHSLGAAISALLVLHWVDEFPDWDIHGYGYATPCCISGSLMQTSLKYFTTFVHHFDAVTRLSMGSVQDLHNGMRLFTQKVGNNHNTVAIFQAMRKIAFNTESEKIIAAAGEIDKIIQSNLDTEINEGKTFAHLFPAGEVYQLWREHRGRGFTAWEMYHTRGYEYGRLHFSPTMLKDHGSAGYNAAFENLLALSVVEQKIWLGLKCSKREKIRSYWQSFPDLDMFEESYDVTQAVAEMKRESKFRKKALDGGVIRPFLLLVSMSPKRRAALANLTGLKLVEKKWYEEFDSHHEAWHILHSHRHGVQSRGNSSARTILPLKHDSNWYMIIQMCAHKVGKIQGKYVDKKIVEQLGNRKKNYKDSIELCKNSSISAVAELEELVMLLFFNLVESQDPFEMSKQLELTEEMEAVKTKLKSLGFHTDAFMNIVVAQHALHSSNKKANEMYSWGDVIRREEGRVKKRQVAGFAGLGLLSGVLLLSSVPAVVMFPPVALLPIGAAAGIGTYLFTRATPGGLVAFVVGCLQQRLALAFHEVTLDSYY